MESSIKSIYAIGDVTEGPSLAVKAIKQGKAAVEAISGGKPEVDLTFLPVNCSHASANCFGWYNRARCYEIWNRCTH